MSKEVHTKLPYIINVGRFHNRPMLWLLWQWQWWHKKTLSLHNNQSP